MNAVTTIVLAGGKGTRLAGLFPDLPKPLVPVAGEPFLHWLVLWFKRQGLTDFVFSLGHKGDKIENWLTTAPVMNGLTWRVFREPEALGTGGGARACLPLCNENLLITNGDSLALTPLRDFLGIFEKPTFDGAILGLPVEDASRYGSLRVDADNRLTGFQEKQPGRGLINSGIYALRKKVLAPFPSGQNLSLEYDVIPRLLSDAKHLRVFHAEADAPFIDIGTPETSAQAHEFIRKHILTS